MALTPQDAADHEAIRQVLYRYARGVDRGDLDLLLSVYHPEATDHHGRFDGPGHEYAARLVGAEEGLTRTGNHHLTNVLIELDGDRAQVETYFLAYHPHSDDGTDALGVTSGRYLDVFEKRAGEWRILRRRVVNDWTRADVPGPIWPRASAEHGGFLPGGRGSADPSSTHFQRETT